MKARRSSWTYVFREFGGIQEYKFRGDPDFVRHHSEFDIWDHSEENLNIRPIESKTPSWTRSMLSHDQVIKWTKAEVLVDSDSCRQYTLSHAHFSQFSLS